MKLILVLINSTRILNYLILQILKKYEDLLSFVPKNWAKSIIKNQINIFDSKEFL